MTSGGHIYAGGGRGAADEPADTGGESTGGQDQLRISGTDDLLDEIDSLLESNAEDFVKSYVQKGGQ